MQKSSSIKKSRRWSKDFQIDASNDYWGEILLEKAAEKKLHHCAHATVQFKEFEKHYHAVYKEIIFVKKGIKKFEFYLVGYAFIITQQHFIPSHNGTKKIKE